MLRGALLYAAQNDWLARKLPRSRFGRRAAARFMPGEDLRDALAAATRLSGQGIGAVLTHLGEEVESEEEADRAASTYQEAIPALAGVGNQPHVSVKPTHLGLALDAGRAEARMARLAERAAESGGVLWIDMEGSAHTEATVAAYERLLPSHPNLGLCLQAYLRRTPADVERLLPLRPRLRLVKGAYREPASVAYQAKREVDKAFFQLARALTEAEERSRARVALATHDVALLERIGGMAEVQMLYGIRVPDQRRLAAGGRPVRVLISYGSEWFAWYMRRLAERPANVLFALRAAVPGR